MRTASRVVVFDLDGTLTRHDTYLPFLTGFLLRRPLRLLRTVALPGALLLFMIGRLTNTQLKERFLNAILAGASRQDIEAWTQAFITRVLSRGLCREAQDTLEYHRAQGDLLILLTASLDLYVEELGRRLRFDRVCCTKAEWSADRLTGKLSGPNHRGEEKVRCLLRLRQDYPGATVVAYADHSSDLDFLRMADQATLVNGTRKAQRLAKQQGIFSAMWKS